MKNIIVVTGGAGFVGSNLIELLLNKTHLNIISIDNYSSGMKKNHIKNKRVKYLKGHTKNISSILKNSKNKINKNISNPYEKNKTSEVIIKKILKLKTKPKKIFYDL